MRSALTSDRESSCGARTAFLPKEKIARENVLRRFRICCRGILSAFPEKSNPTNGSWWTIQVQPTKQTIQWQNPTNGSWWIVQIQANFDLATRLDLKYPLYTNGHALKERSYLRIMRSLRYRYGESAQGTASVRRISTSHRLIQL